MCFDQKLREYVVMILKTGSYIVLDLILDEIDFIKAKELIWKNRFYNRKYEIYATINREKVTLEKFLFSPEPNYVVVHLNGDYLDFTRKNIQVMSRKELGYLYGNRSNKKTSIYTGVYFCNTTNKWWVRRTNNSEALSNHCYELELDAAIASDYLANEQCSEQATRNFPELTVDEIRNKYLEIRKKYGNSKQEIKSKSTQGTSHAKKKTSEYVGVSLCRKSNKNPWTARIKYNGQEFRLGRFASEIEAARAYDAKAKEIYGEFARTNFKAD